MKKEFITKIDVVSGYLGSGKSTWIRHLVEDQIQWEKIFLVLNEYGEESLESLKEAENNEVSFIDVKSGGCICCGGMNDFRETLTEKIAWECPDRVIIETAGTAVLSNVLSSIEAVRKMGKRNGDEILLGTAYTIVHGKKLRVYYKNLGSFYEDQLQNSRHIIVTHIEDTAEEVARQIVDKVKEINPVAVVERLR